MPRVASYVSLLVALASGLVAADHGRFIYGPRRGPRSALHYFRRWAGMEQKVSPDLNMRYGGLAVRPDASAFVYKHVGNHMSKTCGGRRIDMNWTLHSAAYDDDGVHHAVLRDNGGLGPLQYVAVSKDGLVLVSDPPLKRCPIETSEIQLRGRRLGQIKEWIETGIGMDPSVIHLGDPASEVGEAESLIHPKLDHMSEDCSTLFTRTAKETCNGLMMYLEPVSVKVHVVDGYGLLVHGFVSGPHGRVEHRLQCVMSVDHGEDHERHNHESMLPEEDLGMETTIIMSIDICQADRLSTVSPQTANAIGLAESKFPGELSHYKGYRHVYDHLPRFADIYALQEKDALPPEVNLVGVFPKCFPSNGQGVVQDQGNCGSCWAFAAASALMANICMKSDGKHSAEGFSRRFEISTQRIMTCNRQAMGCNGGNAIGAADSFDNAHMALQSALPYECGHGSHVHHFEVSDGKCSAFPWGGNPQTSCSATDSNLNWKFGGLYRINGEGEMMSAIAQGNALFTTIDVPEGLMFWANPDAKNNVFTDNSGGHLGGHAVVSVGYGVNTRDGLKYWLVQNSWGTHWGDGGMFKLIRGTNMLRVEEGATYLRGWSVGSPEPPIVGTEPGAMSSPLGAIQDLIKQIAAKLGMEM